MEKKTKGWVQNLLDRVERPMIVILHVGILMQIFGISAGNFVISISTVILAMMYLLAISLSLSANKKKFWSQVLYKAAFLGCSISLFGLFFKAHSITGHKTLLLIGSVFLILVFINIWIQQKINPQIKIFDRRGYIRNLAIIIVGVVYYCLP